MHVLLLIGGGGNGVLGHCAVALVGGVFNAMLVALQGSWTVTGAALLSSQVTSRQSSAVAQ